VHRCCAFLFGLAELYLSSLLKFKELHLAALQYNWIVLLRCADTCSAFSYLLPRLTVKTASSDNAPSISKSFVMALPPHPVVNGNADAVAAAGTMATMDTGDVSGLSVAADNEVEATTLPPPPPPPRRLPSPPPITQRTTTSSSINVCINSMEVFIFYSRWLGDVAVNRTSDLLSIGRVFQDVCIECTCMYACPEGRLYSKKQRVILFFLSAVSSLFSFLRATTADAVARPSHRNFVYLSVRLSHRWICQKRCANDVVNEKFNKFVHSVTVSQKRCEIRPRLLSISNRMSYTGF